jgi:multiple sugar transport system ATP-binding protein
MNMIPARLEGSGSELFARVGDQRILLGPELRHKANSLATADILIGLRPERIRLSEQGPLKGEISTVEYMGREIIYRVSIPGGEILVVSEQRDRQSGQAVAVAFDTKSLHLFAA